MPRMIVTDKLRSYGAAHREVMPSVEHRAHNSPNNRAENSHQPTRQRERAMKGFRSTSAAQWFLSAFSGISPHLRPRRHRMTAPDYRAEMTLRFTIWNHITESIGPACPPQPDPAAHPGTAAPQTHRQATICPTTGQCRCQPAHPLQ
ncbi:hypothetical protein GCM10009574_083730 [Streptomyces asiaticus]